MSRFLLRSVWFKALEYRSQNARLEPEQSIAVVDATSWNIRPSSILLVSSSRRSLTIVHGTSHHLNKDGGTKHLFPICLLLIFLFYHAWNVVGVGLDRYSIGRKNLLSSVFWQLTVEFRNIAKYQWISSRFTSNTTWHHWGGSGELSISFANYPVGDPTDPPAPRLRNPPRSP